MCFVDIDDNTVEVPEDLPVFPHREELSEELCALIKKYNRIFNKDAQTSNRSYPGTPKREKSNKMSGQLDSGTGSWPNSPKKMEILQQSEAWMKISNLAKKTGVWDSIEDFAEDVTLKKDKAANDSKDLSSFPVSEVDDLKFSNAVREIFLNRFVHMFASYEAFVIQPSQDMESWLNNRESMQIFDKASFLSDQPETHLPFLSPFTETQMFTTFIDNKIVSMWEETDPYLHVFDDRIKMINDESGDPRTPTYSQCPSFLNTGEEEHVFIPFGVCWRKVSVMCYSYINFTNCCSFQILNKCC